MSKRSPWVVLLAWTLLAAGTAGAQTTDVTVELDEFGVGGAYRPGDVVAIRLTVTSLLDEPTPCRVQWEVPNAEGDVAEYGRQVTLSPGMPTPVWLYAPVGPLTSGASLWSVRLFEERDEQVGRELGGARISPALANASMLDPIDGAILIVGRNRMGLDGYRNITGSPSWRLTTPPGAHEETHLVSVMPDELPDRWEGLKMFEAVVWADARPQELRLDVASALREYVRRGGQLVIVLPQAGNPWELGTVGRSHFEDIMPTAAPRTDESVSVLELLPVISKTDDVRRDIEMSIRVFADGKGFDAIDNFYEPLIALPDDRVVAIQRLYGFGRITLIGIELTAQLAAMRLPQADVLWNRVLGRRQDTAEPDELAAMDSVDPRMLARSNVTERQIGDGRIFEGAINENRTASAVMVGAFVLFGVYFLVAGPGGFFLLKQHGQVRHAWLAFAATAGVFTAVAWGGVRLLRAENILLKHVTVLDHVARAPGEQPIDEPLYQRAVCWSSLYLPWYGTARVAIESEPRERDLLLTWWAPEKPPERFPNVDRYYVDVGRGLADQEIPVRATATQFYMNWMGALDPDWGGPFRLSPDDPIRVEPDPRTGRPRLRGTIRHELPGPLINVRVIWVTADRTGRRQYAFDEDVELPWTPTPGPGGRAMLNSGGFWVLSDLHPGDALVLGDTLGEMDTLDADLRNALYQRYIRRWEGDGFMSSTPGGGSMSPDEARNAIEMLSFFHALTPPKYHRVANDDPDSLVLLRRLGRELDLSPWFARPCLIIIGYLPDSPTPIPLTVDGEPAPSEGLTVVRWIYPLPVDEQELSHPGRDR